METTQKIIHTFLYHSMPSHIRQQFQTWCLDKEQAAEKERLLHEEWDALDPASILPTDESRYRQKFNHLRQEIEEASLQRHRFSRFRMRMVAAAAVIGLVLLAVEFVVVKRFATENTVCLLTAENSKGQFTLPDGTIVWLNADTQLSYSEQLGTADIRRVRLIGEAFFDVHRDTLHPFEVEMGALKVRVLGTRFNACCIPAFYTEEVMLQSGSVAITTPHSNTPILLSPDQNCTYDTQTGETAVAQVVASNYYSWLNDSVVFDNATLADILINIEHKYNIRFQTDGNVDTAARLSFTLYPETLDETLSVVETLAHVRCYRIDQYHVLISK